MILLTTMLIISAVSILVLSTLQGLHLYTQANSQLSLDHRQFYRLESAAHHAMKTRELHLNRCRVNETNPNALIESLLDRKGCLIRFGEESYQFLMADLGQYPCLQVNANGQLLGSQHTLLTIANEQKDVLQLRIARSLRTGPCEQKQSIRIHPGILSWRLIDRGRILSLFSPRFAYV